MAFLDNKGLTRVWANILSLVDKVVPQKIDEALEETDLIFNCGTAAEHISEEERLEGDGQEFYTAAPSTLSFRSTEPLNEFQNVTVNGEIVDPANYELEEGSTIVKLKWDYLNTLPKGDYEVAIVSKNKTVKGGFNVNQPELNEYGFYCNQPYSLEVPIDEEGNVLTMLFVFNGLSSLLGNEAMIGYVTGVSGDSELSDQTTTFIYSVEGSVITAQNSATEETLLFEITSEGLILDGFGELSFGSSIFKSDGNNLYIFNGESYTVRHVSLYANNYSPIKSNISNIPVTRIGAAGYSGVSAETLNPLIIPEGITHIGNEAFADASVSDIYLPSTLVSIGSLPFLDCSIDSITFAGTCAEWGLVEGRNNLRTAHVFTTYIQCSDGQVAL